MHFISIAVLMFLALVAQHFLGEMPGIGGRILLMPVLFFYGAAALPLWGMLGLALLAGLMWDALMVQMVDGRTEVMFGWSVILYAGLGLVMNGLRPLFLRGFWLAHCVMVGLLTSFSVLVEYLIITFRREPLQLVFTKEIWLRMAGSGVAAIAVAVPVFLVLNLIASWAGLLKPEREID